MILNHQRAKDILQKCSFPGYTWRIEGDFTLDSGPTYLQACFNAPDAHTGEVAPQSTRKWLLSQHMTDSELVQTALKCVLTSVEHEAREQFTYRGEAIFGPHLPLDLLVDFRKANRLEVRS